MIALACWELGYDLVGCEIDKTYHANAVERLEQFKQQQVFPFLKEAK